MALFVLAPLARMTRASMLAVAGQRLHPHRAARWACRGWRIIVTYALRNALLPVLTIAGIVFSTMLGANVLVEKVFSWPGVASYALDALLASDYAPVQGFVLLMASIFVMVNLHGRRALRHRRSAGVGRMSTRATAPRPSHVAWVLRGNPVTAVAATGALILLSLIAIFAPVDRAV